MLELFVSLFHDLFIFTKFEKLDDFSSRKDFIKYITYLYLITTFSCILFSIGCLNLFNTVRFFHPVSFIFALTFIPVSIFVITFGYRHLNKTYKI
ncbi:hypothetical protein AOC36_05140 [Erysipelothrix larvae]|uniref:Uncharacterized protein n=1 Tax=Erysipelothrix larvae TaxID=1514105 RepID=A0A0X8GZP3_9FIRM|nr:hypothetical protein [Erysipelothrix larvae]AMC93383.1 hypothetical protein AOC36_05140 [Erysipelothrix larvae]